MRVCHRVCFSVFIYISTFQQMFSDRWRQAISFIFIRPFPIWAYNAKFETFHDGIYNKSYIALTSPNLWGTTWLKDERRGPQYMCCVFIRHTHICHSVKRSRYGEPRTFTHKVMGIAHCELINYRIGQTRPSQAWLTGIQWLEDRESLQRVERLVVLSQDAPRSITSSFGGASYIVNHFHPKLQTALKYVLTYWIWYK